MLQEFLALSIFGGFVGFIASTLTLLGLFILAEHEENGFIAFFGAVVYVVVNHYWGNVPLVELLNLKVILSYLGVGFIYAVVRTYFYGRNVESETGLNTAVRELKGNVFRWWFIWPISFIFWLVSDFMLQTFEVIWDKIGQTFRKILTAGYNSKLKDANKNNNK